MLYKLDNGIDHILIDEAQDTSPEQWAIVRKLTEEFFAGRAASGLAPRTIFAVGDEKQSIFSFQGADPAQFDINRQLFRAPARPRPSSLSWTSRCSPRAARRRKSCNSWITVFADPAARAGLTSRDQPIAHRPIATDAKGGIEFWPRWRRRLRRAVDPYLPVDAEQPDSPS